MLPLLTILCGIISSLHFLLTLGMNTLHDEVLALCRQCGWALSLAPNGSADRSSTNDASWQPGEASAGGLHIASLHAKALPASQVRWQLHTPNL
jgi:hypothetical protein